MFHQKFQFATITNGLTTYDYQVWIISTLLKATKKKPFY